MIELQNVVKTHHRGQTEVHALRGVSCRIETGSFNFIVGPSGSGKSSLLYLLGALDEPSSGQILVHGRSLTQFTESERDEFRRTAVGFIFQNFNLLANLDAVENVLAPFLPRGVSPQLKSRAIELLHQVGLGHRLHHRPAHLSGGEQQRISIARALLKNPQLVLADEPTGELDSTTGAEVFQLLRDLTANNEATVVVVTHDQTYFRPTDRILRMRDGQMVP